MMKRGQFLYVLMIYIIRSTIHEHHYFIIVHEIQTPYMNQFVEYKADIECLL